MTDNLRDQLEKAREAIEGALVYKGADGPLWTALERAVEELATALAEADRPRLGDPGLSQG